MKKNVLVVAFLLITTLSLTACQQTDVIGGVAKTSFEDLINAVPNQINADNENGAWSLTAPDGTARFIWSLDSSKTTNNDVMIEFEAAPFIAAGLDTSKLPEGTFSEDKIKFGVELGNDELEYSEDTTPIESFEQLVDAYRESFGYHSELDHYNVGLGNGNMFEWAKDIKTNDKDIVFVLNPQTFIDAGVNPDELEGWLYTSVKMMDANMKPVEEMKLLKVYNLQ